MGLYNFLYFTEDISTLKKAEDQSLGRKCDIQKGQKDTSVPFCDIVNSENTINTSSYSQDDISVGDISEDHGFQLGFNRRLKQESVLPKYYFSQSSSCQFKCRDLCDKCFVCQYCFSRYIKQVSTKNFCSTYFFINSPVGKLLQHIIKSYICDDCRLTFLKHFADSFDLSMYKELEVYNHSSRLVRFSSSSEKYVERIDEFSIPEERLELTKKKRSSMIEIPPKSTDPVATPLPVSSLDDSSSYSPSRSSGGSLSRIHGLLSSIRTDFTSSLRISKGEKKRLSVPKADCDCGLTEGTGEKECHYEFICKYQVILCHPR